LFSQIAANQSFLNNFIACKNVSGNYFPAALAFRTNDLPIGIELNIFVFAFPLEFHIIEKSLLVVLYPFNLRNVILIELIFNGFLNDIG